MKPYRTTPILTLKHLQEEGFFRGYASTYRVDRVQDQIMPGAFTRTLYTWQTEHNRYPHLYWEHDAWEFIGTCQTLKEDEDGLFIEGKLSMDLPKAQAAYRLMKEGKQGLSIGFYILKSTQTNGIRQIHDLQLQEVSVSEHPCNPDAQIHEVKSTHDNDRQLIAKLNRLRACLKA